MSRAERDPSRRATHSCKSSIGRMKRVIRYDHSMYNTLLRYSASHGFYRYFGFEKRHPSHIASHFARTRLLFLSPAKSSARLFVSPRERINEGRHSFREEEERPHLTVERLRGGEKPRARRSPKIRTVDHGDSDCLYCT